MVEVPPGLEDDSESEVEVEELVDSDSDGEDEEMKEWLAKLGMKKTAGGEVVIVRREMKEAEVKMEKKVVKSSVGEARRGMEEDVSVEEEIFIGDVGAEKRRKMRIKFQVADVKKPLISVRRIVEKKGITSILGRGRRITLSSIE